jgi:hypothetical protein
MQYVVPVSRRPGPLSHSRSRERNSAMKPTLNRGLHLVFVAMLIAGLALAFQPVPAAHAATIDVTTNNNVIDANGGVCVGLMLAQLPGPDGLVSLREAICAANTNAGPDTIDVPAGTYTLTGPGLPSPDGPNSLPNITTEITINGNGAIIERAAGPTNFRIFHVGVAGNLTLNDVTIRGGRITAGPDWSGGGIYNRGTLTLNNSTVANNTAGANGGGILNRGNATLTNSTVSGNTANVDGGGIDNESGGTLTLNGSTVSGNTANNDGGGIDNESGGALTLNSSTVSGNNAGNDGGGIWNAGTATLNSSTVRDNLANAVGGGIFNLGILGLNNSTVGPNNTAGDNGGGILNGGDATLTDSTVLGNAATGVPPNDGWGGGIFNAGPGTNFATLTLTNSTIGPNNSARLGGGIANGSGVLNRSGRLDATNSTISGNTASLQGGGIHNSGPSGSPGEVVLLNVTIIGNRVSVGGNGSGITTGGPFPGYGTTTLTNTIVALNPNGVDCLTSVNGAVTSGGGNLDSDGTCGAELSAADPLLGPLANNGGPTQTHALLLGSPAIDTGDNGACPATDQRGYVRNVGPCDIGAYEFGALPPQPPAPGGGDTSEGTVGPGGLTLGDGCVKIIVEADAYPVGSIVAFDSNPSPDNSKVFGDFRLDEVLFFKVWVRGPDSAPMTEFSPPLLVCAQPCRGGEGTTLFDWDEAARMWRAWPTFVQDGWHCTDWYGDLVPPGSSQMSSGDQTVSGNSTTSGETSASGAGQTSVGGASMSSGVASAPSIGLPETGAPPDPSGLARIAFGVVIGLGMISGGVMLSRRAS